MTPTDLSDVNANTYTYLMNGTTASGNWTGLFRAGEKVRLRFINGSSMTYFDVRIPGLKMTVVAADGQPVHPVSVDEFRIAVAETYDVIVEPAGQDAYTIFAQDMGRTGYVSGTLATRVRAACAGPDGRSAADPDDGRHGPRSWWAFDGCRDRRHPSTGAGHAGHDMPAWIMAAAMPHRRQPATVRVPRSRTLRARPATRSSTCRHPRQCRGSTIPASGCATTAGAC